MKRLIAQMPNYERFLLFIHVMYNWNEDMEFGLFNLHAQVPISASGMLSALSLLGAQN